MHRTGEGSADFEVGVKLTMDVSGNARVEISDYDAKIDLDVDGAHVPTAQARITPTCKFPPPKQSEKELQIDITGSTWASKTTLWTMSSNIEDFLHDELPASICTGIPTKATQLIPPSLNQDLFYPMLRRAIKEGKKCSHGESWAVDRQSMSSETLLDLIQHRPTASDVPQFCHELAVTGLHCAQID